MEPPCTPISCAFYDELLVLASRGCQCEIRYGDDAGEAAIIRARLKDVFSRRARSSSGWIAEPRYGWTV
ncbi:MAG: hypothetical protein H0X52_00135 [Gemmatimonadetes bacterium]|jgi:hypothetical protein|nr:hypothetical protein [Gemmatimonadota bacterium]MDQ3522744.1 hypothetical protein [Gemmatimonadota bacterium]